MTPVRFVAASAVLVLAGCTESAPSAVPLGDEPFRVPWEFEECTFVTAQRPVDAERLADVMPAGTRAARDADGRTQFGVRALVCEAGHIMGRDLGSRVEYADYFAAAHASVDVERPAGEVLAKWRTLMTEDLARADFERAGLDVVDGRVDVTDARLATHVEIEFGEDRVELEFVPSANAQEEQRQRADEFTSIGDERLAVWRAQATESQVYTSDGVLRASPGSLAAEFFGQEAIRVTIEFGHLRAYAGTIEGPLPARG